MDALQEEDEDVGLPVPQSTYEEVEEAVIRGDSRAVAELLTSVEVPASFAAVHPLVVWISEVEDTSVLGGVGSTKVRIMDII